MHDTAKHAAAIHLAELLDQIDTQVTVATSIRCLTFDEITPALWLAIQVHQSTTKELLLKMREGIQEGSKILGNDALLSHVSAVLTTD